jgi:Tfp pilus assembly protein FimT
MRSASSPAALPPPRVGTTLLEVALVCAVVGVVTAIAAPAVRGVVDGVQLRAARDELAAACAAARQLAILRGQTVTLTVDEPDGRVVVATATDTVVRRDLAADYGVAVTATRTAVTFAPTGLGVGLSNLSVALARGRHADTVFVSRLGRVRR